jgi:hypothetical protein
MTERIVFTAQQNMCSQEAVCQPQSFTLPADNTHFLLHKRAGTAA